VSLRHAISTGRAFVRGKDIEFRYARGGCEQREAIAGQGRTAAAQAGLEQVRRKFADLEMPYDAALASLDLAALWLNTGRTAEVKELAIEMEAIFRAKNIHREALAALVLFWEAAKREAATLELVRGVIAEIETAKRSASPGDRRPDSRCYR
jgi:hypothetical protein